MDKGITEDLDWLLFNKKKIIGCYCVQFVCGKGFERIFEVGKIDEIYANDTAFTMKVDGKAWLLYLHDAIVKPSVRVYEDNVVIEDRMFDVKYVILRQDRPK